MNRVDELLAAHAPWVTSDRTWPLTPFELFMWFDDRPRAPLVFQVDLCFDGPVDAGTMREAFRFALGRHPLLRSTIRRQGRGAEWVAAAGGWPEMGVFAKDAPDEPGLAAIDLTVSPGLRGWMRETSVGWNIKLLFHHACCDGQGSRMFIQDMVLAYAVLRGVSRDEDPFFNIDISHLDRRGRYPSTIGLASSPWRKLQKVGQFFLRSPRPTASDALPSDALPSDAAAAAEAAHLRVGFCSHTFSAEEVLQLQAPQRRDGVSLNDVAVAILFSVLGEWQRTHRSHPDSWVRISVPYDLRGREDERMPAANRYTYAFLNRRLRDCGGWPVLLEGVQAEMQEKRQTRAGVDFLAKLGLAARWPRLLRWVLGREACFATAVLTNLSDPSRRLRKRLPVDADGFFWLDGARCHDLQVRTPPLRPKTHWGIGIFEYAGRMTVTFRYDTQTISAANAERVLGHYIDGWRQWLAATDRSANPVGPSVLGPKGS
jgi:hypothetical protein